MEYKRDKKGRYIEVVGDSMNIEKVYLKDEVEVKLGNVKDDKYKLDLEYWNWRGEYGVKGKTEWKVSKGKKKGRIYRVEEDRILYFDEGDIVMDNESKVLDSGVWRFRMNKNKGKNYSFKKSVLGVVVIRFGGVIIILFLLFRLLNRIF